MRKTTYNFIEEGIMGAYDAIKVAASQPIGEAKRLRSSIDYKKYQALMNSANTTHESNEAYQERMAKFRLKLAKQIREENTTTAEKRYKEILSKNLFQSNDAFALKQGQNEIESLLRFTYFNNTNPLDLSGIKAQQSAVEARLASLKKGLEPENNTPNKNSTTLYNGEWQGLGQRDFLS